MARNPRLAALGIGDLAEVGKHTAKALGIKAKPHVADDWMFMGFPVFGSMTPYIDKYHKNHPNAGSKNGGYYQGTSEYKKKDGDLGPQPGTYEYKTGRKYFH